MSLKIILTAFLAVFLAEIGDKTQLSVITLSASSKNPWSVFVGAGMALVLITGIGAALGGVITKYVQLQYLNKGAAIIFIGLGLWIWFQS